MPFSPHSTTFHALRREFQPTLRLALPLALAEIGWMSMGVVDTIMVGRLANSAIAIGATGLGQSIYHSVAIFGGGLLLGMDTFVAQAHGRDDIEDARHSLVNGFFLALVLTPILMLLVSFWPVLMRQFGVSLELVEPMQPILACPELGHSAAAVLFRASTLSAGSPRGASHHVCPDLRQCGEPCRRLGFDLRASRLLGDGHHRLCLGGVQTYPTRLVG
jgi:MatE